ncbi:MAG TPA: hypothetical protein VLU24_02740 [Mycobacterium sp.]|nr:hypothetical protein [Mycobacterium sp.]
MQAALVVALVIGVPGGALAQVTRTDLTGHGTNFPLVGDSAPTCVGDCNDSRTVSTDELVKGVRIALGTLPLDQCLPLDCNGTRLVTVDCIVNAVSAALSRCEPAPPGSPTPTPTAMSTGAPPANTPTTTPTTATAPCGAFLGKFGSQGSGDGQFFDPEAVAVDQRGTVFVADTGNHRIEKVTGTGTFLLQWGSMGSADGQFHSPEGVAADGAGNVFVTDLNNNRIEKFDNQGTFLTSWGAAGTGDGQFSGPVGVAVDATGDVYVADRFNNRVQKFTNTGSFITKWGSAGSGDGQFANPVGVAVDQNLNVFVADFFNDRIQKFTSTGAFLTKWGSTGSGDGQFIGARAVAVDEGGDVFAVDDGNDRVEEFTDTGTFLTTWGSGGTGDGQFNSATAVAVDGNGQIFVTDESNRVQRFACPPPIDEAGLTASARVATEPIFRLFDFQARIGTPGGGAGRGSVSGCQQFDCVASGQVTGTERDCCSDGRFSQMFDHCTFDDGLGGVVSLTGSYVLETRDVGVCTGVIPVGASFMASLSGFTHDVLSSDGSFSRTFHELSETFEAAPGGCAAQQAEPLGFGIRGDGRRVIDGELQQFQSDASGHVLVDSESDVNALEVVVGSTGAADRCTVTAALTGSLTSADFLLGTQFKTDVTDLQVVQQPRVGALLLGLNGTVGSDCLGDVKLSTVKPLRVDPGDTCFTAGLLDAQLGNGTMSATYAETGLDLAFGPDRSLEQHFATCADVPVDQCSTTTVGLCGVCTAEEQCQAGLSCFSCSRNCAGNASRCSPADTFVTCADGVF